jgi:hypothetical protein
MMLASRQLSFQDRPAFATLGVREWIELARHEGRQQKPTSLSALEPQTIETRCKITKQVCQQKYTWNFKQLMLIKTTTMQTAKHDDDQFFPQAGRRSGGSNHTVLYGTMLRQDIAA